MDRDGLKSKLFEVITNIEERTDSELIAVIKDVLIAVGTGSPIDEFNDQYKLIYQEVDKRLSTRGVEHPNHFEDLWEFHDHWKIEGMTTYASRRHYVRNLYKDNSSGSRDWDAIHPVITGVARSRFESKHFADAVEAAYKEINSRVKEAVRQITGETYDGAPLMNKAFSPTKPIIQLDDLATEDGRNVQQGYLQMFAGAMIAIRNPKAHSNQDIDEKEAMPLIHLASLLFKKFEEAVNLNQPKPSSIEKNVFVRVVDADDVDKLLAIKSISSTHPGNHSIILVLGDLKKSSIRLPFGVDPNKKFLGELKEALGDPNVIFK